MIAYPKIETLFARNKETFVVDDSQFKVPEFAAIKYWLGYEKIDGMNMRVDYRVDPLGHVFRIAGRGDNAQIPGDLAKYIYSTFSEDKLKQFAKTDGNTKSITFFGEGYGPGIQKGGDYCDAKEFCLFDILIDDKWWLRDEDVIGAAQFFGIRSAPLYGSFTSEQASSMVEAGFHSAIAEHPRLAEGLILRPYAQLFDRRGHRIIAKLKTRDYIKNGGK